MTTEEILYMATSMTAFRSKEERDEYMKPKGFVAKRPGLSAVLIAAFSYLAYRLARFLIGI